MEHQFWNDLWEKEEIGFHMKTVNTFLTKYYKALALPKNSRIFIPLCGKTLDIGWLLSNGHKVVGVELSEIAIEQLFLELGITPKISILDEFKLYSAKDLDIFVGDIFNLTKKLIGPVYTVFDRGGLVALLQNSRLQYAKHIIHITKSAPQLLITFQYDMTQMEGPPFSISQKEIETHYKHTYTPFLLETTNVEGPFNPLAKVKEKVWHLQRFNHNE
ncbi:thiopurine S-methyltransferase [bacterium]|jgi:thiopurine S-methyltransferase|nr:thiopurine S-methyltransferase [bacterium]